MKKILPILLIAFVSLFIFSCKDDDNFVDHDTFPVMADITGTFSNSNSFAINKAINIQNTDVVLVYRNVNSNTNSSAVWQLIPKTYFLDNVPNFPNGRELDYNFVFNAQQVQITTSANFDQTTQISSSEANQYLRNQNFRLVFVPADPQKNNKSAKTPVDYNDYNAVIKYYKIDESKVVKY